MNKRGRRSPDRDAVLYPSYWVVSTLTTGYPVSGMMARLVEQALDRWPRPRWVRFVDLSGAVVRLRAAAIESIEQSAHETRSLRRRLLEEQDREADQEEW
jgi:hypothetical protein